MKLEVLKTTRPTSDSISLQFKKPAGTFEYFPGQHGVFKFEINGQSVFRTYSFSSSPDQGEYLEVTVRPIDDGLVSNHLIQNPTSSLDLSHVAGDFYLRPSENTRHLAMFAGGSGITPIMAMLRFVLNTEPKTSVSLVYINKSFDRIIFRPELDALSTRYPHRLKIYHILTRSGDTPEDYPIFYRDRPSRLIFKKIIKSITADVPGEIGYYMCGPHGFMQLLDDTFETLNVDKKKIYRENFYIPENTGEDLTLKNLPSRQIKVQHNGRDIPLFVDRGESILHAALRNNMSLRYSCTEGQCGVCRALLISGEVKMRKNHILSDDEIGSGQVLLCQGHPASDDVVVKP